jgi:hypothetical protein
MIDTLYPRPTTEKESNDNLRKCAREKQTLASARREKPAGQPMSVSSRTDHIQIAQMIGIPVYLHFS